MSKETREKGFSTAFATHRATRTYKTVQEKVLNWTSKGR